jgi:hypothetical protein
MWEHTMPIKDLDFHFRIPLTTILNLVAVGHAEMKIDVFGDNKVKRVKQLNGHSDPKLLEAPKKTLGAPKKAPGAPRARTRGRDANGEKITAIDLMMRLMASRPDHTITVVEARELLVSSGLSAKSAHGQAFVMRKRGLARRTADGNTQLTAAGLRDCLKAGYKVVGRTAAKNKDAAKASPVKAKKKSAAAVTGSVEATPAVEEQHG